MRQKHFYTMELMNDIFSDCVAEDAPAAQDHGEARNRRQKLNILPKRKYKNRASTWVNTNKWEEFIQNSESSGIQAARNGLSPKTNAINHLIEYRLSEFRSVSRRWITDTGRQWSQESDRSYSVIMRLMQDVEFPLDRIGDILNWSKSDVVIAVAAEAQIAKSQRECLRTRQAMSKQSLGVLFYFFSHTCSISSLDARQLGSVWSNQHSQYHRVSTCRDVWRGQTLIWQSAHIEPG